MLPDEFAREIISLNLPLTGEEWKGLMRLCEMLSPGITCNLEIIIKQPERNIEGQAWEDFVKWVDKFRAANPEQEDTDIYELALMYPDK